MPCGSESLISAGAALLHSSKPFCRIHIRHKFWHWARQDRQGKGQVMATARDFLVRRPHLIPASIAAMMLLAAVGKWPYAYYQVMRWAVCAAGVFVAYKGWMFKRAWALWVFGLVAVLFNPLLPIHLKRETWAAIDVLAAAIFVVGVVLLRRPITGGEQ